MLRKVETESKTWTTNEGKMIRKAVYAQWQDVGKEQFLNLIVVEKVIIYAEQWQRRKFEYNSLVWRLNIDGKNETEENRDSKWDTRVLKKRAQIMKVSDVFRRRAHKQLLTLGH